MPFIVATDMRRRMLTDSGLRASTEANALFLFDPRFMRAYPERVREWVDETASRPFDPDIAFARIDMIVGHDAFDDLPSITTPTLVAVGRHDFCAPPHFSAELAKHSRCRVRIARWRAFHLPGEARTVPRHGRGLHCQAGGMIRRRVGAGRAPLARA
jgi:pimeloyl-ACP methyl ester carboxylesterase